jgi:acyl-CoA thioesterase YciA
MNNDSDIAYAKVPRIDLPNRQPTLRVVPQMSDANPTGDVFGGWVMSRVDQAGGVCATLRAVGRVATVAVNAFQFNQPIMVGDVVSFYGEVTKVGNTSITIDVQVFATHLPRFGKPFSVKVTEAVLTFVALNADGTKRQVPEE